MEEKKDIERIFQERFKQFEVAPPQDAWSQIEARLEGKKKRRVVPILWWQLGGVAAVLAIIVAGFMIGGDDYNAVDNNDGYVIEDANNNIEPDIDNVTLQDNDALGNPNSSRPVLNDDANVATTINNNLNSRKGNATTGKNSRSASKATILNQNDVAITTTTANNTVTDPKDIDTGIANSSVIENGNGNVATGVANNDATQQENEPSIFDLDGLKTSDGVATVDVSKNLPEDDDKLMTDSNEQSLQEIADAVATAGTTIDDDTNEDRLLNNRWSAATVVAPVFANSFNGSSINNNVGDASGDINISYGVAVDYNISPRLSVRTGVHQMNVAYNTNDVSYSTPISAIAVAGSAPGSSYNPSAVSNNNAIPVNDAFSQELVGNSNFGGFQGELSQQLGYLEVPLELKYRLIDSRLGINVLGGFSALFLTDNEVNISGDGRRLELGEDRNFQDFNQSANFGLGLDYKFTKNIGLSIEPTFKYQLNALRNDVADFRPYTIGVYTGLMYRF